MIKNIRRKMGKGETKRVFTNCLYELSPKWPKSSFCMHFYFWISQLWKNKIYSLRSTFSAPHNKSLNQISSSETTGLCRYIPLDFLKLLCVQHKLEPTTKWNVVRRSKQLTVKEQRYINLKSKTLLAHVCCSWYVVSCLWFVLLHFCICSCGLLLYVQN